MTLLKTSLGSIVFLPKIKLRPPFMVHPDSPLFGILDSLQRGGAQNRGAARHNLVKAIKPRYPNAGVHIFGSVMTGTSSAERSD